MKMYAKVMLFLLLLITYAVAGQEDKYTDKRKEMVYEQIELRGVTDKSVLEAMRKVPRHRFVPADQAKYAYADRPLAIGYDQTISQPYIVGYMTQAIHPGQEDVVLEIGTGSGYQAAVLAEIVKEVYTIEIVEELADRAQRTFRELGYDNIQAKAGDGYHGWEDHAPYDAIIVTAAPSRVPPPLIEQLKEGGRMIIPVGSQYEIQYLKLITKKNGKVKTKRMLPVRFVPFTRD